MQMIFRIINIKKTTNPNNNRITTMIMIMNKINMHNRVKIIIPMKTVLMKVELAILIQNSIKYYLITLCFQNYGKV